MSATEYNIHSVRFPASTYAKLRVLADLERRTINNQVVVAVEKTITDYEREHGPIPVESEVFNN